MDEQIAQFVSITGLDSDRAKFFVESSGGDVETALSTYYESEGNQEGDGGEDEEMEAEEESSTTNTTGPRTLSGAPAPSASAGWGDNAATSSSSSKPGAGFSAGGGRGGIATLRDLQSGGSGGGPSKQDEDSEDEEEEDSKGPANFYTGGERSGLNVQNPNRGKGGKAPDVVQDILKKAAEASASGSSEGAERSARAAPVAPSFTGMGRTINDEGPGNVEETGQASGSAATPLGRSVTGRFPGVGGGDDEDDEEDEVAVRNITFWEDGFSIADGPLCRYDDPQHAQTLALIQSNRAPLSLLNVKFGQRVELRVEKKTNEKYKAPPPPPMKPFGGSGNRLGAPVPAMTGGASSSSTTTVPVQPSGAASAPEPSSMFQVDSSQPSTQIQIRLGDGQKMVAKFNHSHTVADIRRYINASHPGMTSRDYTLQSSFPPKPLTDEGQTLSEAGLINAVVIQKWS